jgi:Xaa-Pro aminopeptidase
VSEVHAQRRARVLDALGADGALVLYAAPELRVGADTDVRYLPDPDLFYLTGYTEPEAVLVLAPSATPRFTLFVRPRDPERERWTGVRGGVDAAREVFGADSAHAIDELPRLLPQLIAGAARIHAPFDGARPEIDLLLRSTVQQSARSRPRTGRGATALVDARTVLAPLRAIKDVHEIALMRAAARITVESFRDLAAALPSLRFEYEAESVIEHGFRRRGAWGAAFPTIAAGGANATVLHYTANSAALPRAGLLLVDAGARMDMYCADVTRTFPVSGRFDGLQREAYDVVRAAHAAAVAQVAPGRSSADLEDAALRVLTTGMVSLGLLQGDVDGLIERREYRRYFPHRVSHWLGLDVHDAGDHMADGAPVPLREGMVLTIEPGLYVPEHDEAVPAPLRGLGIRLEDDALVTADGAELLTGGLEIDAAAVEALTAGG